MKKIFCPFLVFFVLTLLLSAKKRLAEYLPENAWVTMEIENLGKLQTELNEGPFGKIWNHPAIDKVRARLIKQFPKNAENGPSKEFLDRMIEFSEKLTGQVAFGFGGVENMLETDENDKRGLPEAVLLADTTMTSDDLEEFMLWFEKEVKGSGGDILMEKEEVAEEDVFFLWNSDRPEEKESRLGIFVVDGVFCLGGGRSTVEEMVESIVDEPSGGILDNPDYRDVFDEVGSGDVRFFVNFRGLGDILDFVRQSEDMQVPENPFGVTTKGILDALGLEGLECVGLGMDFGKEGLEIGSALFMGKREGLLQLMRYPKGHAPLVPFVPSGVFAATVARYDLGAVWPVVEEIIRKVSPALHLLVNSQIQAFETKAGVNVRKDLLGGFGEEIVTFSDLKALENLEDLDDSELPVGEFYAISLRDSEVFDRALRTMLDAFAPGAELFQDREHKGVTVRTMRGTEGAGIDISYAITSKWLLLNVGDRSRMLRAINRLEKSRKSLWKKPSIVAALREAPEDVKQLDYLDMGNMMEFLFPLLGMALEENFGETFFEDDLPSLPYFMLGWTRDSKRGFISKAKLFRKEQR